MSMTSWVLSTITMEVLLLQDITGIGKKNDLLLVGDGYALNFLLPQNKAIVATPTVRRRYAEQIRRRAEERLLEKELQAGAAKALSDKEITFERKTTKTGKLYAAVSEKNITEALAQQLSIEVQQEMIKITKPIKEVGEFEVIVKIGEEEGTLKVSVKEEK